jgi:type II secretory pathway component PulK
MMKRIRQNSRRGAVLLAVLVCLIVITIVCGTLLKQGLAARGQLQAEERRLQARWLAESGLERAAARLESDITYPGETWKPSPDSLGGSWPGQVTISVSRVEDHPNQRLVQVQADYPSGATYRVRQHTQAMIDLNSVPSGDTQ